jgi:hypothetical protein
MTLPHAGTGMRLRVEFEPSLLSTAARSSGTHMCFPRRAHVLNASKPGLQRCWFCAPATLHTMADLAAAVSCSACMFGEASDNQLT